MLFIFMTHCLKGVLVSENCRHVNIPMGAKVACINMRSNPGYSLLYDRTASSFNTSCSYVFDQINRISPATVALRHSYTSWAWLLAKWHTFGDRWR